MEKNLTVKEESSRYLNMLKYMNKNRVIAFANTQNTHDISCFYNKEKDEAFKKNDDSWELVGL